MNTLSSIAPRYINSQRLDTESKLESIFINKGQKYPSNNLPKFTTFIRSTIEERYNIK